MRIRDLAEQAGRDLGKLNTRERHVQNFVRAVITVLLKPDFILSLVILMYLPDILPLYFVGNEYVTLGLHFQYIDSLVL